MAYQDRYVAVDEQHLVIKGYYFPGTTKRIPLASIRSVRRSEMGAIRGKARIWGTANPRYWANFDPGRPKKTVAFVVDAGKAVRPFLTPDDPVAFEAALRDKGVDVTERGSAPIV